VEPGEAMKHPVLRRLFHVSGIIIPLTYLFRGKGAALILGALAFLLLAVGETLRLKGVLDPLFVRSQLKEKETKGPTGSLFYVGSCLLTMVFFDKQIAVASMFVLVISDPLSSEIGSRWGRCRLFDKSVEGTATFLFSSILILTCLRLHVPAVLGGACAGTAAELFSSRLTDDNLTIPLATALALRILS
jgi:dolichol kinase